VRIYLNLRSGPTWPAKARLFNLFHPIKHTCAPTTFTSQGLMLTYYNIYNLFISIFYLHIQIGRCSRCVGGNALTSTYMEAFKLGSRHASLQLMRSPQPSCMQGQRIIILSIGDYTTMLVAGSMPLPPPASSTTPLPQQRLEGLL
jgi:hypothetical protein